MIGKEHFIALNRFGLGPRPADLAASWQPQQWLRAQIAQPPKPYTGFSSLPSYANLAAEYFEMREMMKEDGAKKELREATRNNYQQEMQTRLECALSSDAPFYERLVQFWSNHFTVAVQGKPFLLGMVGAYEREAIRPHVLGNFADLLLAVVRHPAMLMYLDNAQSIGPNSPAGQRREKGLNENLAREILELHTLGVSGGYTQADVIALANIITGWTINRKQGGAFQFIRAMHEPGPKTLLGKAYDQGGEAEGEQALRDLAAHPSTAQFLATKLARHFIADKPDAGDVKRLADACLQSGGNLRAVYETLIQLPNVWREALPKVKTPYELIVSTLRLMDVKTLEGEQYQKTAASLQLFQHVPFTANSPAGWPDTAEAWISPDALMNRLEWCHALALKIPLREEGLNAVIDYLAPVSDAETLRWLRRAPSVRDGFALALSSPAHQRR